MNAEHLFEELLRAAEQLGMAVRIEPFETPAIGGGGRCVFRGEQLVLIDAQAPLRDRIRALARALAELDAERVFMVPEAREVVEAMKGAGTKREQPGGIDSSGAAEFSTHSQKGGSRSWPKILSR